MCDCKKSDSRQEMVDVLKAIAQDQDVDVETRVKAATAVLNELKTRLPVHYSSLSTHSIPLGPTPSVGISPPYSFANGNVVLGTD